MNEQQSPTETRTRRSKTMIGLGVLAMLWGVIAYAAGGNAGALVLALLGVGLLVGGLVIRP